MGCDIHMYAEVRRNGKWEAITEPIFKNMWFRPKDPEEGWNTSKTVHPYDGRNYNLFAILANVRNGRGFAGIKTSEGFNPIDEDRGLPEDVSDYCKESIYDHSFSWLGLPELLAYDWNQVTVQQGWVTIMEYEVYKRDGKPDGWCGDVSRNAVRKISNVAMDRGAFEQGYSYYTLVKWGSSYRDSVGDWWFEETIPALRALDADPENVRIVFGFDS